jgi:exodeoxyribonuclease V gamma subunit
LGIAAAIKMQLPSLFIWSVYRSVLSTRIPKEQLLAKAPLTWRLYRLLPTLITQTGFETLASFLVDDPNCRKRHQLAEQLADLFDQYQVYRSDWISDWADSQDILRNAQSEIKPIPEQQRWQASLWRLVLKDLDANAAAFASRASVHTQFMTRIDSLKTKPAGIPRRIIVFGLSSLPQQSLEVLAKLGKFCQIVLFVHNPCQHYWADIIEDKELFKAERRRQAYKPGITSSLSAEELHLRAPPLLAAWGKQGRDYLCLLDQFDETQSYANWPWPENKIDLFKDYGTSGQRSLLQNLQQSILDLDPLPDTPTLLDQVDKSIAFHIAHSAQREVEILHDQLLARFEEAQQYGNPLYPREVIVMVPDINTYAPHIRAVFGLIKPDDPRYIPFSLADQQQRGQNPMLVAVESLLNLPESRFTVSEFLGLLEVPALRARFDIDETATPKIHQWLEETGIRWGLNAAQRAHSVAMPPNLEANTWQFGMRRMLLGYAVGAGEAFNSIEPYDEMGGLDAKWLGGLSWLLETLEKYAQILRDDKCTADWQQTLLALLEDFFIISNERDRKTRETLVSSLILWSQHCDQAGLQTSDLLPIHIVREAWLTGIDEPSLNQRFLSGRVNFCTLMPMRAIPFRLICLLGMNDGDYPRNQPAPGFDLMTQRGHYRPGDRSRRQDDQYLFLEAILSVRQQLYISWIGHSIRDNSARPPSVLISQLREVLSRGWTVANDKDLLDAITVTHPLQAFSPTYLLINRDRRLFTYAREWFEHLSIVPGNDHSLTVSDQKTLILSLESLARFLRTPVKIFCNQTLKFGFDNETITSENYEPFSIKPLEAYGLSKQILDTLTHEEPDDIDAHLAHQQSVMQLRGQLPLAGFAQAAFGSIAEPVKSAWQHHQLILSEWPVKLDTHVLSLPTFELIDGVAVQLTGDLSHLRQDCQQQRFGLIDVTAQNLVKDKTINYHSLLLQWLQHLAACANAAPVQTLVTAHDAIISIPVMEAFEALAQLHSLVDAYYQGMKAPLPVACKSAFAWLVAPLDKALEKAAACYEGDDWNKGEVDYDAYQARFFPRFADLYHPQHEANFDYWADRLYRPVFDYIKRAERGLENPP